MTPFYCGQYVIVEDIPVTLNNLYSSAPGSFTVIKPDVEMQEFFTITIYLEMYPDITFTQTFSLSVFGGCGFTEIENFAPLPDLMFFYEDWDYTFPMFLELTDTFSM